MYRDKVCKMPGCGCVFTPTTGNQKYCLECRDKAKRERERKQWKKQSRKRNNYREFTRDCEACGIEFTTYYSKKIYCGSVECERARLKNKDEKRSKEELRIKHKKYYDNNREKCLLSKAKAYRDKNPDAGEYTPGLTIKLTFDEVKEYIESRDYKLLSAEYINNNSKLLLMCPNGHEWRTTFHRFKSGARCMTCYTQNNYVSKPEQAVRDYFEENHPDLHIIYNDRSVITPKELDLYFPESNTAVEICGLYWHCERTDTPKNYHYNKMMACFDKGVRLITVFEDEIYDNFDIVISKILQAIGKTEKIIYAEECSVECISTSEANKFFVNNHLQGGFPAEKVWALVYNDEIVSACSVGESTMKYISTRNVLELQRLCDLIGTHVVGGVSKLFLRVKKYTLKEKYGKIVTHCDMRYANIFSTVYEKLGFSLESTTRYSLHYFRRGKRHRSFSIRKTKEERLIDELNYELRQEKGYDKIWDCGYRIYTYELTNL